MQLNTQHLKRCIQTLEQSLLLLDKCQPDTIDFEMYRNSAIKGFELTLEISAKLLKKALKPYFASAKDVDRLTFKDIFRHAANHDLISLEEAEHWFLYRDNRNSTTHDYGVDFAEKTRTLLPEFIKDAGNLEKRL